MKLFSGSANEDLGRKIAKGLHLTLSPREIFTFPDGERRIQIQEKVINEHVVIVQSTTPPVDQAYFELFFLADAAKRSGASHVTAVIPYLGYQRQDHVFREGEAVSLEVIVMTMESVGIDHVIAVDLHSIKIPEVFTIPITHLSALPLFAEKIRKEGWTDKETRLIAPDEGGMRRIKLLSESLSNMPYSCILKSRDRQSGKVTVEGIDGDVTKRAIIVDDMISRGSTTVKAAEFLRSKGAEEIYAFATHAIFSDEAPMLLSRSIIKKIYITDSVFVSDKKRFDKLEILSVSGMIATELREK